jgi:branched-chain amino acid transport system ATP-binding protein
MTPILEVSSLSVAYGHAYAVRDLDLHLEQGEILALMGPNGAGKSSALMAIAGAIQTRGGKIRFDGQILRPGRPSQRAKAGLRVIPEGRSVFREMTVAENLRLGGAVLGGGDVASRAVGYFPALEPLLNRKVSLLSGGEQQMLCLGGALATRPKVLLIDEMSLGLAPVAVNKLMSALVAACRDEGVSAVVVEQHVGVALDAATRVQLMRHGRVVLEGLSADYADDPSQLMASYVGHRDATPSTEASPLERLAAADRHEGG